MTLLDRITDYQKDLAEIERELGKYRLLLGPRQVQFKDRNRDAWIAKNRETKTVKERYRRIVQAIEGEEPDTPDSQGHGDDRDSPFSDRTRRKSRGSGEGLQM